MNLIQKIINGYYNLLFGKKKPIYKLRLACCNDCPKKKGAFCSLCGCYLKAKVSVDYPMYDGKSVGGCPLNKW